MVKVSTGQNMWNDYWHPTPDQSIGFPLVALVVLSDPRITVNYSIFYLMYLYVLVLDSIHRHTGYNHQRPITTASVYEIVLRWETTRKSEHR